MSNPATDRYGNPVRKVLVINWRTAENRVWVLWGSAGDVHWNNTLRIRGPGKDDGKRFYLIT